MEPNQDDPGEHSEVFPHTTPLHTKELQAALILEKCAKVFCALQRIDSRLETTEELIVPETGSITVAPPKRLWRSRRARTPELVRSQKRCWKIGDLFDAKAYGPQSLYVATDGTPYCLFGTADRGLFYVEVTKEFLLEQSGSVLIFATGTLDDKLEELAEAHPKSA